MRKLLAATLSFSSALALHASDIVITGGRIVGPETGLDASRHLAVEDALEQWMGPPFTGEPTVFATTIPPHAASPLAVR